MARHLTGEELNEAPAYGAWRTTALALQLEAEVRPRDALVKRGTYSPYRALDRAREDYGLTDP
ncbi:MAG: hypothetical protein IPG05_10510 [Gemmatimonadetes bacterium]|nr:hypothetical protein [Gemmatimonadota bacterium]